MTALNRCTVTDIIIIIITRSYTLIIVAQPSIVGNIRFAQSVVRR